MATKKVKRYDDGGMTEEDYKKRGLEESKNDRVGLLERFRMGNIDDPRSEAYKRFGAGRGRSAVDQTKPKPAPVEPTPEAAKEPSLPVGLRSALTPQGEGEGGASPSASQKFPMSDKSKELLTEKTTVKTPKKTVTKTEKIKTGQSGIPVDEKGIAQRRMAGLKAPSTDELKSVARTRAGTAVPPDNSGKLAATMAGLGALGAGMKGLRSRLMRPDVGGGSASRDLASSPGTRPRLMGIDPSMELDLERMAGEGGPNFKKGGKVKKPVKKYASGGSVSSASKRADGIAKKGKTKGRIF